MRSIFSIFTESINSFTGQEIGEDVIMIVRRHPFFIIIKFIIFLLFMSLPIFVGTVFSPFLYSNGLSSAFLFITSILYLILWQTFFYSLTMYTLDVWIVTDRRIIDSTQHGFFNRTISELHISRIQDISVNIGGPIQTFFHFGDLKVQTAGTEEKFDFIQIPNPEEVKNEIMKICNTKNHTHSL